MSYYRIATMNHHSIDGRLYWLSQVMAVLLTDARIDDKSEYLNIIDVWENARDLGFTAETFSEAFDILVNQDEIINHRKSGTVFVCFGSKAYTIAKEMGKELVDYHNQDMRPRR